MTTLVVLHRPEVPEAVLREAGTGAVCVAPTGAGLSPWVPPSASCRLPQDYLGPNGYRLVERTAVQWLKSLAHHPLDGGERLHTLLRLGPVSLWWFIEAPFYRFIFKPLTRWVALLSAAIEQERADRVVFVDDGSLPARTTVAVARAMGMELCAVLGHETSALKALLDRIRSSRLRWAALQARDVLRRLLSGKGPAVRHERVGGGLRLLVASMGREQVTFNAVNGRWVTEDLILAPVLRAIADNHDIEVKLLYKFPYWWRSRVPGSFAAGQGGVRPWEAYLGGPARDAIRREVDRLRAVRHRLWTSATFTRAWTYQGIDLWPVVRDPLARLWEWELFLGIRYMVLCDRVIEEERPEAVLVASETSLDNKALVVAATRRGIPVVALQHGTILPTDDYLVDYAVGERDLTEDPSKTWFYPTTLCLFGEETRRVMVEEIGYPYPDRLAVTGQPRFDTLLQPVRDAERIRLCRATGVDPKKKVVLVASQTFHIAGDKEVFLRSVLRAFRGQNDLEVVIKPHPLESARVHRKLAREEGIRAVVLRPNLDMHLALGCCDVLITSYSTVAVEAMLASRPVVTINLTGSPDIVPYAREGASLGVSNAAEILPSVRAALYDDQTRNRLLARSNLYLARAFQQCDGKATNRLLEAITFPAGHTSATRSV